MKSALSDFISGKKGIYGILHIINIVSAGTSNKISKCQKREIKPLYNN